MSSPVKDDPSQKFSEFNLRPQVSNEAFYCRRSFFGRLKPLHPRFYAAIDALIRTPGVQKDIGRDMREVDSVKFVRPTLVNNLKAQLIEATRSILLQNCVVEKLIGKENVILINCTVQQIFCDGASYNHDSSGSRKKFNGYHVSYSGDREHGLIVKGYKFGHDLLTSFKTVTLCKHASLNGTINFQDGSGKPFDGRVQLSESALVRDPERIAGDILRIQDSDVREDDRGKDQVVAGNHPSCKNELILKKKSEKAKHKRCCIKITFGRACAFAVAVGAVAYAWLQRQQPQTQTGGLFSLFGK